MRRKNWSFSRLVRLAARVGARAGVLGLAVIALALLFTSTEADARRYRHHRHHYHHHHRHHRVHRAESDYTPLFSSIVVDANSGATLQASNPDALRHPASLTKIMTLYLLFERLEAGRIRLDSQMPVSEHASDQAPTKLGLHAGQSIKVEDAIKGLVTRSANDAAVVIAESLGGSEEDFAQMMTHKARALGMSRTTYRNASGLPSDQQLTTARDQATLGRAIKERFPVYYRFFSTRSFAFRGRNIPNHNHLLSSLDGVDGIKTGYTHDSGFNLVTSIRRGNRHLVGVVLGGRSADARDATMRRLLVDNLVKASSVRSAALIERNSTETPSVVATRIPAVTGSTPAAAPPSNQYTGSTEPIRPVRVRTVNVKAGSFRSAATVAPEFVDDRVRAAANKAELARAGITKLTAVMTRANPHPTTTRIASAAAEPLLQHSQPQTPPPPLPPQPPGHGTGNGILGVLPASALHNASAEPPPAPPAAQSEATPKPVVRSGWLVQVGALDNESEARQRIEAARNSARGLLNKATPFTETAIARDNRKIVRARFAGLEREQAENVCRALKRASISCITIHN
ncbi:MAG: D-alanyl-D-alanine carboxypeptidase [Alphaproteobacteria bacterium]|nr:D-alanyl-D-alanine carboxypeptidase [Alphaproteobacteria bacterium]